MLHRHDEPIETPDAGWSIMSVEDYFDRQRRATQERDRSDALGALTWLSDLFWLGVLVAASIAVGACVALLV